MSEVEDTLENQQKFQDAIERLLASENISEELKLVAIQNLHKIADRYIKEVE